jgi:23S rRNA (uracil1939-C5)-methyltransferase
MQPRRIVYVSCDPATLARDVSLLKQRGYALKKAMAADLFPRCAHVESVVTLSKGEIDCETVIVDFSLEEFDMASIVNDPTYPKIKEYVLEHTGLKVSSLYIAQVKKKCGLEVGECYNKPKSENSKTSVCPPEKEQAIMDAFRYFGMI